MTVTLDAVEEQSGGTRVVVRFETTLSFSSDYGESFDAGDTKTVSGSFDAVLTAP